MKSPKRILFELVVVFGVIVIGLLTGLLGTVMMVCICCALYGLWIKKGILPKVLAFVLTIFILDYTGLFITAGLSFLGCIGYGLWKKKRKSG